MTRIGPSLIVRGDVVSADGLTVDGQVYGQITARDGTLSVGPTARIEADITGADVVVQGHVRGNITATQRIELSASADVAGTLSATFVALADGARFNGRIDMGQRTIAAAVARHRAEQGAE